MKNKKLIIFLISILIIALSSAVLFLEKNNFKILETSILSILRNVAEQNKPEPPDIGIDSVVVKKISDPTEDFNYYKYKSTIILHNYGGNLKDARVILHAGKNQKHTLVKNTDEGFTLLKDESYIIRNYEFVFDGRYNGGVLPITVDLVDGTDYYEENDEFVVKIFAEDAKIESISLDEILDDGTLVLDFNSIPFTIRKHDFEILTGNSAIYDEADARYDEIYTLDEMYGYYRIKNSLANVNTGFDSRAVSELEAHFVDSSLDEEFRYAFVKATNPETGNYAVSNMLMFPPKETMNKAEFAKIFIDQAEIEIFDEGIAYFEDISNTEWYYPYVQTLYNLGLTDTYSYQYYPDDLITRGEILKIIMDYYDVDLVIEDNDFYFEDMSEDHSLYPYIQALKANAKGEVFEEYFYADGEASKNYLNYLINEYSESY
jgi:hypothetical protein